MDTRPLGGALLAAALTSIVIELAGAPGVGRGLEEARQLVEQYPRSWKTWQHLGNLLEEGGSEEEALEAYEEAMNHDAEEIDLFRRAARLAGSFGLFDEARVNAELGLYLKPDDRDCRLLVAKAYHSMERLDLARPHLERLGLAEPPPVFRVDRDHALLGQLRFKEQTPNFVIRTDINRVSTERIARTADIIFGRLAELVPGLPGPRRPVRIFVFNRKQGYTDMLERYEGSHVESEGLTIMDPGGTIRVISCIESGQEIDGRIERGTDWINRILLHEINHVAMILYTRGRPLPLWLAEGWAEYTSGADPAGPGYAVGRLLRLRADGIKYLAYERKLPFPKLSSLLGSWSWKTLGVYEYSWSLVHFLHHGQGGKYRERFRKLLEIARTDPARAFARAYEGVDLAQLEQEWKAYALSL